MGALTVVRVLELSGCYEGHPEPLRICGHPPPTFGSDPQGSAPRPSIPWLCPDDSWPGFSLAWEGATPPITPKPCIPRQLGMAQTQPFNGHSALWPLTTMGTPGILSS